MLDPGLVACGDTWQRKPHHLHCNGARD